MKFAINCGKGQILRPQKTHYDQPEFEREGSTKEVELDLSQIERKYVTQQHNGWKAEKKNHKGY